MSIMKLNWGAKIALLYGGFVTLIVTLVFSSMRQSFDLVAPDYYSQEIKYQDVINAGKNQATLSSPVNVNAGEAGVILNFPMEFEGKAIRGTVNFYSPQSSSLDKQFPLVLVKNAMQIPRSSLHGANYKVKILWEAGGKDYYQETVLTLN